MRYSLIVGLLFLMACNQPDKPVAILNKTYSIKSIDISQYAIFKPTDIRVKYYGFDEHPEPANLSTNELLKIENLIYQKVVQYHGGYQGKYMFIENPQGYYKQLIAKINNKKEKEVLVICICSVNDFPLWKKKIIIVNDGGSCYFNLKINLTTNTISDFSVNGVG